MSKLPRDYQEWAHGAVWNYVLNPTNFQGSCAGPVHPKAPLVVEATGLGKSMNIAMLIWHLLSVYPKLRIMQLCHVKELVQSNYEEMLGMWPTAPAGVYAAGLKEKNDRAQVTFAMINSVAKRPATFGSVDFVIVDEAHRLSPNDAAMYSKFIEALRRVNPKMVVVGYTATPYRTKGGLLTDIGLFDEIVYDIGGGESFLWAVQQGYLIMPVPTEAGFTLDDSGIGISAGDFKDNEASAAMHEQDIIEKAVEFSIAVAEAEGRQSAIAFTQSINDSELVAEMLTYKGYPTEAVHSKRGDRDKVLAKHKHGDLWGVSNKDILTTGWNNPIVDLFIGLRLTRSPGLWVQMVGRMTRPSWGGAYTFGRSDAPAVDEQGRFNLGTQEGRLGSIAASHKQNARVLDFTGNTMRLGPINYPNLPKKRGSGGGTAPVRTCDKNKNPEMGCRPATLHHTSVEVCPNCGYVWPKETNLRTSASNADLVTDKNPLGLEMPEVPPDEFEVFSVHEMIAVRHKGKQKWADGEPLFDHEGEPIMKPDTCKVSYRSGHRYFHAWVCFGHDAGSFARKKAEEWWKDHGGQTAAPGDITMAIEQLHKLNKPKFIRVLVNSKFMEIKGYDFKGTMFEELDPVDQLNGVELPIHEPEPDPMESMRSAISNAFDGGYFDDEIPF